jgi:processive 1,2-diacylglycerol beta-glucosyltransferase
VSQASVLIVSASAGTGHLRAGDALREAFELEGTKAEHVDVLSLAPAWVRTLYGGTFELLASRAPRIWRELYDFSDGPSGDRARWGPVAARVLFREFRRLLRSQPWRCCVCTHFLPSQLAAGRAGLPPFVQVMTDFVLHRYWVQPRVRDHFVPGPEIARDLAGRILAVRVQAAGIPISPVFERPLQPSESRAEWNLDPTHPVALVMGGGLGLGVETAAVAALAADVPGLQVVAVTGRNAGAKMRLERLGISHDRLRVLGYVQGMERLLPAADVVVTKPGGLTTSEALAVGKPLILTRPIPGHEAANFEFLSNRGVALGAPREAALTAVLARFFREATLRQSLAEAARGMGAPGAARRIARAVRRRHVLEAAA